VDTFLTVHPQIKPFALFISFYNPSYYKLSVDDAPANTYSDNTFQAGTKSRFSIHVLKCFWLCGGGDVVLANGLVCQT
jgi:hypothetical protein